MREKDIQINNKYWNKTDVTKSLIYKALPRAKDNDAYIWHFLTYFCRSKPNPMVWPFVGIVSKKRFQGMVTA